MDLGYVTVVVWGSRLCDIQSCTAPRPASKLIRSCLLAGHVLRVRLVARPSCDQRPPSCRAIRAQQDRAALRHSCVPPSSAAMCAAL